MARGRECKAKVSKLKRDMRHLCQTGLDRRATFSEWRPVNLRQSHTMKISLSNDYKFLDGMQRLHVDDLAEDLQCHCGLERRLERQ